MSQTKKHKKPVVEGVKYAFLGVVFIVGGSTVVSPGMEGPAFIVGGLGGFLVGFYLTSASQKKHSTERSVIPNGELKW